MVGRVLAMFALAACGRLGFGMNAGGDGAMSNGDGGVLPDTAFPAANYAFVTSKQYSGNLGGLAGADALCALHAAEAGLPGTYVAWLSTDTVNAPARLGSARGWIRRDGLPFADTAAELAVGNVFYPLDLDENGVPPRGNFLDPQTITGTGFDGMSNGMHCSNWTDAMAIASASGGDASAGTRRWYGHYTSGGCDSLRRFYCFGIDRTTPVVPSTLGRRLFVTQQMWSPGTGIAMADALCQTEAQAASLPGTYKALIGTSTATAISRFDTQGEPWMRLDGVAPATSMAAFVAGTIIAPIHIAADKTHNEGTGRVATGGLAPNQTSVSTCSDWTVGTPSQQWMAGTIGTTETFFAHTQRNCDLVAYLYCLQE